MLRAASPAPWLSPLPLLPEQGENHRAFALNIENTPYDGTSIGSSVCGERTESTRSEWALPVISWYVKSLCSEQGFVRVN